MGAGASASYELSKEDKVTITKAIEETYNGLKAKSVSDDAELYHALKNTFEHQAKAIEASKKSHQHGSSTTSSSSTTTTAITNPNTFTDINNPPRPATDGSNHKSNHYDPDSPQTPIPIAPTASAVAIHEPPLSLAANSLASTSAEGGAKTPGGTVKRRTKSVTLVDVAPTEVQADDDLDEEETYQFNLRNSVQIKPGSMPSMSAAMISSIEGPGKLLKAKTSTQLLSMVDDSALDENAKIAAFISQLKAGEVQTKGKTEFRQRRLTYSQQTVNESPSIVESTKHASPIRSVKNRTTIFASSEIGVVREKQPPFPNDVLGTYSCHGIEPSPDEEDGIHEKINQDRGCVVYPYNNKRNEALLMVLDGHGEQGDKVSEFVMRQIVVSLEKDPLLNVDPIAALKNAYITTNTALLVTDIHYMTSGCTCVTIYVKGNTLYVANAGDSRAVMAKKSDDGQSLVACDLTRDHKPDDPEERVRIEGWGGYVCPPYEEGLSARVYLDPEFTMIGLAMSRSIGDHAVKNVGVIAEPEVKVFELEEKDQFLVMASDGVWEFINSQEAVEIVHSCLEDGVHDACQELIEMAATRWQEEEGDYRDDITAIVVKFPLPNFIDAHDDVHP